MAAAPLTAGRFRDRFGFDAEVVASAPARVNIVGEHTDYNEGFALPMAIDRRVDVAAARSTTRMIAGDAIAEDGVKDGGRDYVAATLDALAETTGDTADVALYVSAGIPRGSGLASSAALEMAVLRAVAELHDRPWHPVDAARIGQRAENVLLGVRTGVMDQVAAASGVAGCALLLDCRDLHIDAYEMPRATAIVAMDSGARRRLTDSAYNERRAACERAVSAIAHVQPGVTALRDVSPRLLEECRRLLDAESYRRARHVVHESPRPAALLRALSASDFEGSGAILDDSHASLRDLYEVSSQHLEILVDIARTHPACFGARLTGAGFGGFAIALVDADGADDFINWVQPRYEARTYLGTEFFVAVAAEGARLDYVRRR